MRATHNSNPLNPHDAVARLPGSFASIVARRESTARTPRSRPAWETSFAVDAAGAFWQPRTAIAWQFAPRTVLRTGFGVFSDHSAGKRGRSGGRRIRPTRRRSKAVCWERWAERRSRRECRAAPSMRRSPRIRLSCTASQQGELSCASPLANPDDCLQPVAITAVPDGKLHAPYFMQWSFALEHQIGNTHQSARAVCGHARREPALHDAGERLSDGVRGMLRAVPLRRSRPTRGSRP